MRSLFSRLVTVLLVTLLICLPVKLVSIGFKPDCIHQHDISWASLHSDTAGLAVSVKAKWRGEGECPMCKDAVSLEPRYSVTKREELLLSEESIYFCS
jgi:hypothetical protein